jgi:O-antigen ligase
MPMNRTSLDRFCERGILGLVLAILVFGPLSAGAVRTQEFVVLLALTAGVLLLWGARLWLGERPKLLWPPVCWGVLAFVLYAVGCYLACDIEYVGRLELLRVLVYAALFFAILNNLHSQESTQVIAFTAVFLAMTIAMCAIWQYLARADKVPALSAWFESVIFAHKRWYFDRLYADRGSGTYMNPNHLAGYLEMLLPLALAYTLAGRAKPLTKVLLGYAALVILVGIGVTGSRGSWIATGVALLFFFGILASHRSYRLPALLMMVLLGGASIYFVTSSQFFKQRAQPAISEGRLDLSVRYELWEATVQMWRDHPWFGVGPGHFDYRFRVYRPPSVQLRPDRAHNEYLNLLADWGVAGAAMVGGTLCVLFAGLVRTWRHVRRSEREFASNRSNKFAFVVGAAVGLLALLGHSVVDFNLQIPANAILAVSLMALLSSHLRFATEQYWVSAGPVLKTLASLVLAAGVGYFTLQSVGLAREYVWLEQASTKGNFSDAKIAALEKAYAVEPRNFETSFAIGESYRVQSFEGGEDYEALAQKAMLWLSRGTNCNPFDDRICVSLGRCLDWLGRTNEARAIFDRAVELDPNGYYTSVFVGRHYVDVEDYAAARQWLERSVKLQKSDNPVASNWLGIVNRKLLEGATNQTRLPIR